MPTPTPREPDWPYVYPRDHAAPPPTPFGQWLKAQCVKHRWTISYLVAMLGVSGPAISRWLDGSRAGPRRRGTLMLLATHTKTPLADLERLVGRPAVDSLPTETAEVTKRALWADFLARITVDPAVPDPLRADLAQYIHQQIAAPTPPPDHTKHGPGSRIGG